jgi:hypothetical protein
LLCFRRRFRHVEIAVPKPKSLVVLTAVLVCASLAACGTSSPAAPTGNPAAPAGSASSSSILSGVAPSLSDAEFEAARKFSKLLAEGPAPVTVTESSPFSTWHKAVVAQAEACHTFVAAAARESWPADVTILMQPYLAAKAKICAHKDKLVAARNFAEWRAVPPLSPAVMHEAADLQLRIEKALHLVP